MNKEKLNACQKRFHTSARKQDGQFYKNKTVNFTSHLPWTQFVQPLKGIFASTPKQFSIVAEPDFTEANKTLNAFFKELRKTGKISDVVHKKGHLKTASWELFQSGEPGPADTKDPAQLQRTAWFYLGIHFGRRGRENQPDMKHAILALRSTPRGEEYFELHSKFPGPLPATKNHQGGLSDAEDESGAKIFAVPESAKCPVKPIIKKNSSPIWILS